VVSPLLWLAYINDLLEELEKILSIEEIKAWADDLLVIIRHGSYGRKAKAKVLEWALKNKIEINIKKDKSAIVEVIRKTRKNSKNR